MEDVVSAANGAAAENETAGSRFVGGVMWGRMPSRPHRLFWSFRSASLIPSD